VRKLSHLLKNNQRWAHEIQTRMPGFFEKLTRQQTPEYLWIGCSDSRVPANEIVGMLPGELFVHRNVANLVIQTDINCLSVIQYAVELLRVKHVIVVGHYGCGGVRAALEDREHGLIDNWLHDIRESYRYNIAELEAIPDLDARVNRLCEINVVRQALNVCHTTVVQDAWKRGQDLTIHGWVYGIADGLIKDLGVCVASLAEMTDLEREVYHQRDVPAPEPLGK
jgi:carbonic anhydrase